MVCESGRVQFIGQGVGEWMARMQFEGFGDKGLGCPKRRVHGLCLFGSNQEVTLVTRGEIVR